MKNLFLIFAFLTFSTFLHSQPALKSQVDQFGFITTLMEYKYEISESFHLTQSWVFIDKKSDTPNKIKLKEFNENGITRLNERIKTYQYLLDTVDFILWRKVRDEVAELLVQQQHVMSLLPNFNSYDDPILIFEILPPMEAGGSFCNLTDSILTSIDKLISKKTLEYIDLISRQNINLSSTESLKIKKVRQLLDLLNVSGEIKEILTIGNKSGANRNYLEKDIYNLLLKKYDKYYTINEIDDLIAFYKTKTGKRMIKVSKKMMSETLSEIMDTLK